jgi:hypothetical protein
MRAMIPLFLVGLAGSATAGDRIDRLSLAPETTDPECDPQPSDDEKLLKALAFLISNRAEIRPAIEVNGELTSSFAPPLTVEDPGAVLEVQPNCCWIAYDVREAPIARELRDRLGDNFGGFAYARIGIRFQSKELAVKVTNVWASFVLNACGYPVFKMSAY